MIFFSTFWHYKMVCIQSKLHFELGLYCELIAHGTVLWVLASHSALQFLISRLITREAGSLQHAVLLS